MSSVAGKVFLLGEYAVLAGLPAWIAAVSPRFTFNPAPEKKLGFHPESPAGRLLAEKGSDLSSEISGEFIDPWKGFGGFGRSTAEFALAAYHLGLRDPIKVWEKYRELHRSSTGIAPSGADLLAQWSGGVIEWDSSTRRIVDRTAEFVGLPILLFSATHLQNRKTVTHTHLEGFKLSEELKTTLSPILVRASQALAEGNIFELGKSFTAYAEALASLGLEAPFVEKEREAFTRIPGVLGVKGCGALQTDAMLVMVDSLENGRRVDAIIEYAEREFGLKLLLRGLSAERGIE